MSENFKRRSDGQLLRIKRTKPDIVRSAVGSYVYHRNYPDNELLKRSISLEELASDQTVMTRIRRPNSILLNNSTFRNIFSSDSNPVDIESSFSKLYTWINGIVSEKLKNELLSIISPLFCHLYLDLIQGGYQQSANALMKYYQEQNIAENDNIAQVVKDLASLDLKSRPVVKSFRSTKYVASVTLEAINILKYFLVKHGHLLIIQVFHNWFDFELFLLEQNKDVDEIEGQLMSICNGNVPKKEIDLDLSDLQEAIDAVNSQTPLLNINVYNSQNKATCGQISCQSKKVVAGFNNSEIRVWGLGNTPVIKSHFNDAATKISLACENFSEEVAKEENPLTSTGAVILRGHSDSVQDVSIVQNTLLSVSQDCTMRAWRLSDCSCAAIYRGHNLPIWCLDVNTLGVYIATGSQDSSVKIWTFDRIYPVRICVGHTKDVNSVKFHPNGSYLGSGSADSIVRMFSIHEEAKCVRMLVGHKRTVYSVGFSLNGMYLASAGADKCVKVWDISSSKELVELSGPQGVITDLSWSPDNKYLAVASVDGLVTVWDANSVTKQGSNVDLQPVSVFDTKQTSLLALKYDEKWLTCLSATYT